MMNQSIEPVRKTLRVPLSPTAAFELFTAKMGTWWPLETHSVAQDAGGTVIFEPRVGGRIYEQDSEGQQAEWGTVTIYEPGCRVSFTWHPGRGSETAGLVDVRFTADGEETVLTLVHSGWEKIGPKAAETRAGYDTGWDHVLGVRYGASAGAKVAR